MKPLSTAALAIALMTGVSGIALAASDTSPGQSAPAAAATPAKPAPQTMAPMAQAATPTPTKMSTTKMGATKTAATKPMQHKAIALRRDDMDDRGTTALNLLEAHGYGQIVQFRPDGRNFDATVTQNGQSLQVTVNPDTGQIVHRA
jgi:hypothetical protein